MKSNNGNGVRRPRVPCYYPSIELFTPLIRDSLPFALLSASVGSLCANTLVFDIRNLAAAMPSQGSSPFLGLPAFSFLFRQDHKVFRMDLREFNPDDPVILPG